MKQALTQWVEQAWYGKSQRLFALRPLSWLVARVARRRLLAFRASAKQPPVPVLVVGNITVGGTGKTPLVVALCAQAAARQLRVAIISRGYGAQPPNFPWRVAAEQSSTVAGDEPLMLARKTGVPVFISPKRDDALAAALSVKPDVIISDDGLQHYALPRTAEVAVLDGERLLGNGLCLPAGPLREPAQRLHEVNWVVVNGGQATHELPWASAVAMRLVPGHFTQPATNTQLSVAEFVARFQQVHAVAAIGHPQRFFSTLGEQGLVVTPHAFPDHHAFTAEDIAFAGTAPIVMTEKDAVKCAPWLDERGWVFSVEAELPNTFFDDVFTTLLKGTTP